MLDTKQSWDDLIRRHAPDEATREKILANPLYKNIVGPVRAVPRLHRHGAALRDPLRGQVRPHRRRHPADTQRPGLPRCAAAPGRLLLLAPAALAHRPVPVTAGQRGDQAVLHGGGPDSRDPVPGRHLGVLHPLPVHVRGLRDPVRGRDPAAVGSAHHLHGGLHARGHAAARGRVLLHRADGAQAASRRHHLEQGPARTTCGTRPRRGWPSTWRTRSTPSARD